MWSSALYGRSRDEPGCLARGEAEASAAELDEWSTRTPPPIDPQVLERFRESETAAAVAAARCLESARPLYDEIVADAVAALE